MVIWLVGLSGAGKTTIGRHMYDQWKSKESNTVFVDGDQIRKIFKQDIENDAYTIEGRRRNADRICEICAWLDSQNINVVCCILSLFEESRRWNRKNYSKYFEVYISVPMEILKRRQKNGLYKRALSGDMKNVVGVDIPFKNPKSPDYVFENSQTLTDFSLVASNILKMARAKYNC